MHAFIVSTAGGAGMAWRLQAGQHVLARSPSAVPTAATLYRTIDLLKDGGGRYEVVRSADGYQWIAMDEHRGLVAVAGTAYPNASECLCALSDARCVATTAPVKEGSLLVK